MNPKAQFMHQLQQHEDEKAAGKKRLEKDISEFQSRMKALADEIKGWLRDIPQVTVKVEQTTLVDPTIPANLSPQEFYQICTILVTAGDRSLRFKPTCLYLFGCTGEVELEYRGLHSAPRYKAYMWEPNVPAGKWALIGLEQNKSAPQELDEAAFFNLLSRLIR
ncbi:hypothetical protein ACIP1U_26370 [Cupriavidus sp. NPDC089707]|uniref:hypothetical protein n=1 Tax=Cupriavidus sp. NPDC089707 TaxID=3363963 RepID=UPI003801239A